jgi:uncharacterized protein
MPDFGSSRAAVFITSCVVGVASGLFGIGGGVLLVPLLVLLHHYEQHRAQGTSLVALVPPTGLLAFIAYYRAHAVSIPTGLLIIPGVFFGGILGGRLAIKLSAARLRRVVAVILFILGTYEFVAPLFRLPTHAAP